ncbi:hypothetical protein BS47DRAFT_1360430 [Hydnum rufescens UP504]|uniref:Uncharacterized protein n=1 Tax=Hydnum rufescens UP504 TaxID=1448309 RepID=A0A9P6DZR0_9AGAM|nr:hypothetical protein BS47DRAFT_1360430 [Hydnum rufescens UP504]
MQGKKKGNKILVFVKRFEKRKVSKKKPKSKKKKATLCQKQAEFGKEKLPPREKLEGKKKPGKFELETLDRANSSRILDQKTKAHVEKESKAVLEELKPQLRNTIKVEGLVALGGKEGYLGGFKTVISQIFLWLLPPGWGDAFSQRGIRLSQGIANCRQELDNARLKQCNLQACSVEGVILANQLYEWMTAWKKDMVQVPISSGAPSWDNIAGLATARTPCCLDSDLQPPLTTRRNERSSADYDSDASSDDTEGGELEILQATGGQVQAIVCIDGNFQLKWIRDRDRRAGHEGGAESHPPIIAPGTIVLARGYLEQWERRMSEMRPARSSHAGQKRKADTHDFDGDPSEVDKVEPGLHAPNSAYDACRESFIAADGDRSIGVSTMVKDLDDFGSQLCRLILAAGYLYCKGYVYSKQFWYNVQKGKEESPAATVGGWRERAPQEAESQKGGVQRGDQASKRRGPKRTKAHGEKAGKSRAGGRKPPGKKVHHRVKRHNISGYTEQRNRAVLDLCDGRGCTI